MRRKLTIISLLIAVIIGCTISPLRRSDPQRIIVFNASGIDLDTVYIAAQSISDQKGTRYGAISPVPRGAAQSSTRPAQAPPLPNKAEVRMTTATGNEFSVTVDLKRALKQYRSNPKDDPDKALVFRINPGMTVDAFIQ